MGEWEGAAATFLKAPAIRKTLKAKKTHDTRQNAKGPMTWAPEATALLIRAACQSAGGLGPCKRKGRNKSGLDEKKFFINTHFQVNQGAPHNCRK